MRRTIPGLHMEIQTETNNTEGFFLVRIERLHYCCHPTKPFFIISFAILEPQEFAGRVLVGRLYTTSKALWKLRWFLRDFGYDWELLDREVVDEKFPVGRRGVVKTSCTTVNGRTFVNLEGFAPAAAWEELSAGLAPGGAEP